MQRAGKGLTMESQSTPPSAPGQGEGRYRWIWVLFAVFAIMGLARMSGQRDAQVAGAERTPTPSWARHKVERVTPTPTPRPTTAEVSFLISGSAFGAHITYSDGRGGIHQTSQKLPWEKTITVPLGMPVSISAQNTTAQGAVACRISVNGITAVTATADTAYGIASCSTLVR